MAPSGVTASDQEIVDRLLSVMETDLLSLTQQGVKEGNKVFGGAILRKDDLSLVVAGTNKEMANPLYHGEIHTMELLYQIPKESRPSPEDCIFFATHEPCTLCLSAITWGGYDNFYYLFSHEDSRDSFNIGHDLRILKEVFRLDPGGYARTNAYWTGYRIPALIESFSQSEKETFSQRISKLTQTYAELSDNYQANKEASDIPLK
ncbi:MAG: tRNA-specific adenosine deaminase [Opitutaceae bacterium]|nr:tRNA-specific adenosine deaminase [Opitutaceae bacterium]|tara:strand:+ start:404 stop:1018 length:615 start_codon:yes stop_codon:yes gene_type:complete